MITAAPESALQCDITKRFFLPEFVTDRDIDLDIVDGSWILRSLEPTAIALRDTIEMLPKSWDENPS